MKLKILWFVLPLTFFIFLILGVVTGAVEQPAGGQLDPWFALKKIEGNQNSIGMALTYGDLDRGCICFPNTEDGSCTGARSCQDPGYPACRVNNVGDGTSNYCTDSRSTVAPWNQITFPGDSKVLGPGEFVGLFNWMEDTIEGVFRDNLKIVWPTLQGLLCGFQMCQAQAPVNMCINILDFDGVTGGGSNNSTCTCPDPGSDSVNDGIILWVNRAFVKIWPLGDGSTLRAVIALYAVSQDAIPADPNIPGDIGVPAFPRINTASTSVARYYGADGNVGSSEICAEAEICGTCGGYYGGCATLHTDALIIRMDIKTKVMQNPQTGEYSLLDVCVTEGQMDFKGANAQGNVGGTDLNCDLELGEDGVLTGNAISLDFENLLPSSLLPSMVNALLHGNCPNALHSCDSYQTTYYGGGAGCLGKVDACYRSGVGEADTNCRQCSPCNRTNEGAVCNAVGWGQKRLKSTGIPPIDKWVDDMETKREGEGGCKIGFLPVDLNNILNPYQPFMTQFPGYDPQDSRYGIAQLGGATFDVGVYVDPNFPVLDNNRMLVGIDVSLKPRWGEYWGCIDPQEMGYPQYTNPGWVTPRVWTSFPNPSSGQYGMAASISQDFFTEIFNLLYASNMFCWDISKDTIAGLIPMTMGFDLSFLSELLHVPSFATLAPGVEAVADPDGYASIHLVPAGTPSTRVGVGTYTYPVEYLEDIMPELSNPTQGGLKGDYYRGINLALFAGSRLDGCGTACNYRGHGNSGNGINFTNWNTNGPETINRYPGSVTSNDFHTPNQGADWSPSGSATYTAGWMQLTSAVNQRGAIRSPITLADAYPEVITQWSIRFDLTIGNVATTQLNQARLNMYYDTVDTASRCFPTNGYSIQFDHYNNLISLYRDSAGSETLLNQTPYDFGSAGAVTLYPRVDWLGFEEGGKALIQVFMEANNGQGGKLIFTATISNPNYPDINIGFSAQTGAASFSTHFIDNVSFDRRAGAYSAIWTGYLMAPFTGSYTVCTRSDDGARLFLDNVIQINNWDDGVMTAFPGECASLTLTQGFHPLRLEYYENQSGAGIGLYWCTPSANPYGISTSCGVAMTEANTISPTYLYYSGVAAGQKTGIYDVYVKLPSSRFEIWAPLNDGVPGKITNEPVRLFSLESYINIGMDIEYIRGVTKTLRYWGWDSGSSGSMKTGSFQDFFRIFAEVHPELVDIKYAADQRLTRAEMENAITSIFSTIASSYIQVQIETGMNINALLGSLGMLIPRSGPDPWKDVGFIPTYIGPLGPDSPAIRETQPPFWADNPAGDNLGLIFDIGTYTKLNATFIIPFLSMVSLAPGVPVGLQALSLSRESQPEGPVVTTAIAAPPGVFFESEPDPIWTRGYALSPLESGAAGLGAKGAEIGFAGYDSRGTDIRELRYSWRLDGGLWNVPKYTQKAKLPPLLEGKHIFEVMAIAPDGWIDAEPARLDFTVDTQAPRLKLQNVSEESFITSENPTFVVEASDFQTQPENIRIAYRLDGGEIVDNGFSKVIDLRRVPALEHKLEIYAQDEAGNLGALIQEFFTDTTRGGYGCGVLASGKTSKAGTIALVIILLSLPFMVILALKLHYREKKEKPQTNKG